MASWRFYQGLRSEWRWYRFDPTGNVIAESDQGFAELTACMANAEVAGFTGDAYQVHARQTSDDTLVEEQAKKAPKSQDWNGSPPDGNGPQKQALA
jgi:hypothetical protein